MYAYMFVCMGECIPVCMYVSTCVCMHVGMYVCIYACMYVRMRVYRFISKHKHYRASRCLSEIAHQAIALRQRLF